EGTGGPVAGQIGEAESGEHGLHAGVEAPCLEAFGVLQRSSECLSGGLLSGGAGHPSPGGIHVRDRLAHWGHGLLERFGHRIGSGEGHLLVQQPDPGRAPGGGDADGAGIGMQMAGEDAQQGGLTGAVLPDQTGAPTGGRHQGEVGEDPAGTEGTGDALGTQMGGGAGSRCRHRCPRRLLGVLPGVAAGAGWVRITAACPAAYGLAGSPRERFLCPRASNGSGGSRGRSQRAVRRGGLNGPLARTTVAERFVGTFSASGSWGRSQRAVRTATLNGRFLRTCSTGGSPGVALWLSPGRFGYPSTSRPTTYTGMPETATGNMAAASAAVGRSEEGNCPNRACTVAVNNPAARPLSPPVHGPTTSITDPTSNPAARPSTIVVAEPSHPGIGSAVQAEATVRVTAPTSRSPAD